MRILASVFSKIAIDLVAVASFSRRQTIRLVNKEYVIWQLGKVVTEEKAKWWPGCWGCS